MGELVLKQREIMMSKKNEIVDRYREMKKREKEES